MCYLVIPTWKLLRVMLLHLYAIISLIKRLDDNKRLCRFYSFAVWTKAIQIVSTFRIELSMAF